MKIVSRPVFAAVCIGCVALVPAAMAQAVVSPTPSANSLPTPPSIPGKSNAAILYTKAWESVTPEVRNAMSYPETAGHDKALRDNQAYVESLLLAAETSDCDWGLAFDAGIDMLLPHLGQMRSTARIFAHDAARLLDADDPAKAKANDIAQAGAARRLKALWLMPRQIAEDRVLISPLVGIAIAALGEARTTELMESGALSVTSAQAILNSVRAFEATSDDPFGVRASVIGERELFVGWVRREFTGEDAGRKLVVKFASIGETNSLANEAIEKMNGEELARNLDKLEGYYDGVRAAWDEPDAKERIEKLGQAVSDGDYGPLGTLMLPAFSKVHASHTRAMTTVKNFRTTLETYIASDGKLVSPKEEPSLHNGGK